MVNDNPFMDFCRECGKESPTADVGDCAGRREAHDECAFLCRHCGAWGLGDAFFCGFRKNKSGSYTILGDEIEMYLPDDIDEGGKTKVGAFLLEHAQFEKMLSDSVAVHDKRLWRKYFKKGRVAFSSDALDVLERIKLRGDAAQAIALEILDMREELANARHTLVHGYLVFSMNERREDAREKDVVEWFGDTISVSPDGQTAGNMLATISFGAYVMRRGQDWISLSDDGLVRPLQLSGRAARLGRDLWREQMRMWRETGASCDNDDCYCRTHAVRSYMAI